jgi:hypothetical protein
MPLVTQAEVLARVVASDSAVTQERSLFHAKVECLPLLRLCAQ